MTRRAGISQVVLSAPLLPSEGLTVFAHFVFLSIVECLRL